MTRATGQATLLFGGDLCPIGRYERRIVAGGEPFEAELARRFREHDFAMVNLEAPLCEADLPADNPGGFGLRADPCVAAYLRRAGIRFVGLANNHIRDFGDAGALATLRYLDVAGVRHTGAGRDLAAAQQPLMVRVNGLTLTVWALAERELQVASAERAGSSWFRPEQDVATVHALRAQCDVLVVYLHAGHEFIPAPSPRLRDACRALIEAGADAVVAHHPHVVQGLERYRDGLIAYSLGNLVFDSPYVSAYPHTDVGFLLHLEVARHRILAVDTVPYRLRDDAVLLLRDAERDAFDARLRDLSDMITDDARFLRTWEESVQYRWDTCYQQTLATLSARLGDPASRDFARRTWNLFACPTHVEMLEHAMLMAQQGRLARFRPEART